ncbi:lactonase family protein [Paenibacillus sp. NPDC055715]
MMGLREQLFYTGTYASRDERGIYVCALRVENGDLCMVGGVEGIERPSLLALHPDGAKLYAASEAEEGELYAYQVNAWTGELHPLKLPYILLIAGHSDFNFVRIQ